MDREFSRRGDACPQLLDLIPNEKKDWMVKDNGGRDGFGVAEEGKLELRLAPPGGEGWSSVAEKNDGSSVHSLGYSPKPSNTITNPCAGAKRLFLDTVESKIEGFLQQQQQKAEQHNLEGKKCSASHAAPRIIDEASNTSGARNTSVPVVGWPPIHPFRKNLASSSSKPSPESQNKGREAAAKLENCRKGLFVKINMDGIPIGRKVDLKAYDNYEKLSSAVEELFQGLLAVQRDPTDTGIQNAEKEQAFTGLLDGSGEHTLVYEDSEGDRMLVGDVPWDMFVSTAKRLRVLKSSELSTLSLGAVSRKRTTDC